MRLPRHIGIIPDGNCRWAVREGMDKADGYDHGIAPEWSCSDRRRSWGGGNDVLRVLLWTAKRPSAQHRGHSTAACIQQ